MVTAVGAMMERRVWREGKGGGTGMTLLVRRWYGIVLCYVSVLGEGVHKSMAPACLVTFDLSKWPGHRCTDCIPCLSRILFDRRVIPADFGGAPSLISFVVIFGGPSSPGVPHIIRIIDKIPKKFGYSDGVRMP